MTTTAWGPLRPLGEALRFLTIVPVPGLPAMDEESIVQSMAVFPVAGLVLGAAGAAAGWAAGWLWGDGVRAVVVMAAGTLLTAGLHLDGVADSCDALFSWRPRERMLEIMKDSRIGAMGALGLLVVVLMKVAAFAALGKYWWVGALLAPLWGRWADIYGIFWFPAAAEGGMGRTFHDQVRQRDFWVATALAAGISAAVWWPWGPMLGLVIAPVIHGLAWRMTRTLGGLTGDTYGALSECGEVLTLLALLAIVRHM